MAQAYQSSAYGDALDESSGAAWPAPNELMNAGSIEGVADEAALCSLAATFVRAGLASDSRVVVIASADHEKRLSEQLQARGVEVAAARASGQLRIVEAAAAIAACTGNDGFDARRLRAQLDVWVGRGGASATPRTFIYGELMDLLWREGRRSDAILLEDMWIELSQVVPFPLSCAHALGGQFKVSHANGATAAVVEQPKESGPQTSEQHEQLEWALRQALREVRRRESSLQQELEELRARGAGSPSERAGGENLEGLRQAAGQRTERLVKITAAIAEAVDPPQVLWAVVDNVAAALDASSIGFWLLSDDGERLQLARSIGYRPEARAHLETVIVSARPRIPVTDAVLGGEPIWLESQQELLRAYPHLRGVATPGRSYSVACLPLVFQGHPRGCVGFTFDDERVRIKEERDLLLLVARYIGQAVERLRLLETERAARSQTELAAARLGMSSRASRAFAAAAERPTDLPRIIAEQVAAEYADACALALVTAAGGAPAPAAACHRDAALTPLIHALAAADARRGGGYSERVAVSREPVMVSGSDLERLVAMAPPEQRKRLAGAPLHAMFVPLSAGEEILGTLAAFRQAAAPFPEDDRRLLAELADRAAVAIVAARLHEANDQARARAELLYELAAAVIRANTVEEVFFAALAGIERALGASRCSILAFDPDGVMRFKAWRGLSAEYRRAVEGHSPWDRDADNPQPIIVADVEREPSLSSYAGLFRAHGIGALGFIPLVWEGRLIGKFMVYYPVPRVLRPAELDMAQAIANHIASAMGRFSTLSELQQTVRFNEIFTGMLGHDLRNPLGAIMAAAHIVLRRSESEQITIPVSRILSSGARMARMIDQLLDFTRVRVGAGIPLDCREVDIVPVLEQVVSELRDAHPACPFALDTGGGDTRGSWDADRVAQVLSNLCANAVQHGVLEHGVNVRVDGTLPDTVLVHIHNRGAIPATLVPRLFEPMAGGDRRRQNSQGLGLGLYISREIVKAHGGRIDLYSSDTAGTTFTVHLPRAASRSSEASS